MLTFIIFDYVNVKLDIFFATVLFTRNFTVRANSTIKNTKTL